MRLPWRWLSDQKNKGVIREKRIHLSSIKLVVLDTSNKGLPLRFGEDEDTIRILCIPHGDNIALYGHLETSPWWICAERGSAKIIVGELGMQLAAHNRIIGSVSFICQQFEALPQISDPFPHAH